MPASTQTTTPGIKNSISLVGMPFLKGSLRWSSAWCVLVSCFLVPAAGMQQAPMPQMGAPAGAPENLPRPIDDTIDRVRIRDMRKDSRPDQKRPPADASCLLPPLSRVRSPVISAVALAVPTNAQYEYVQACVALSKGKNDSAEKHLRKAVQIYPQYPAAWVTLGQLLAAENHTAEARTACFQASAVEPNYVPAFLCLAEIAAWGEAWGDVLQFSLRAIQLDPITTPISYEYNADANLRRNRLDEAEKSALRAGEIDKDNQDPRIHFLLAQIYEAKGDRVKEIVQLRLYLTFAKDVRNIAEIKEYLAGLEQVGSDRADSAFEDTERETPTSNRSAEHVTPEEKENDAAAGLTEASEVGPPGCNLDEVLPRIERRVQEFVENVQKFTATQVTLYERLNGVGKVVRSERRTDDYTVSIGAPTPAMLEVREYQNSHLNSGTAPPEVVTRGLPALLLIFHPIYAGDFSMRCEGTSSINGQPAWEIRFRQRNDKPSRIRSYTVGTTGRAYPVDLAGRAWFAVSTFQVIRLEADLARKIPEIQLTLDHATAEYGPVHFQSRGIDIWLPQTVELMSERRGKCFHERITFSDYLLFAIDNKQQISTPKPKQVPPLRFARLLSNAPDPWF